jgi:hypothetical protein
VNPAVIKYTGLEIDPEAILEGRILRGPVPTTWRRVRFEIDQSGSLERVNRWLTANLQAKWASYIVSINFGSRVVVVAFEDDTDAVMFRLKGGETAWKTDPAENS